MSDIFGIGTTIGAVGDAIIGGLNYANQKDALEWQKKQQEYANKWNEYVYEDQKKLANTAVQRQVKDLEAAGINKLMAAGGSAGMGGAVGASTSQITAPQMEANLTEKIGSIYDTVYSMITMQNDIATSETQRDLIKAQTIDTLKASGVKEADIKKTIYDLEKSMKMNIRTTDTLNNLYNTANAVSNQFAEEFNDSMKKAKENAKKVKDRIGSTIDENSQNWRGKGGTYINGKRYGY